MKEKETKRSLLQMMHNLKIAFANYKLGLINSFIH